MGMVHEQRESIRHSANSAANFERLAWCRAYFDGANQIHRSIAAERNPFLAYGDAHGKFLDGVRARVELENLSHAEIAVDVALIVDTEGAADRLPVVDAALIHGAARPDVVIDEVPARMREAIN